MPQPVAAPRSVIGPALDHGRSERPARVVPSLPQAQCGPVGPVTAIPLDRAGPTRGDDSAQVTDDAPGGAPASAVRS